MKKDTKNWSGIMKIMEIKLKRENKVIWEENNILNILHKEGEAFLLNAVFAGGQNNTVIPNNYYLGLDARSSLTINDTLESLISEPGTNGYVRQPISSAGDFTVVLDTDGHYRAISPIVVFQAVGGSWGPVSNLFLTDTLDNSGSLLSTAPFSIPITVVAGDSVTMRISISLKDFNG